MSTENRTIHPAPLTRWLPFLLPSLAVALLTLSIAGHAEASMWAFKLDKGSERVDVGVRAPPPVEASNSGIDPAILVVVGVLLAVLLLLGILLRSADPARAIASIEVPPDAPFTLRFRPRKSKALRVWIRYELGYGGTENDYGVTADLQIQIPSQHLIAVEHRIGDIAVALRPTGTTCTALYRVSRSSGPQGNSIRATAKIAKLPAVTPGLEVVITGRIVLAAGMKPIGLLVFVVPA